MIKIKSLECKYKRGIEKLDKPDPFIKLTFKDSVVNTKKIDNNSKPVYFEEFSFLIDEKQQTDCNIIKPSQGYKQDMNSKDHYLTVDLYESEFLVNNKHVGRRKIHINFLLNEGRTKKGIKTLTIFNTNT